MTLPAYFIAEPAREKRDLLALAERDPADFVVPMTDPACIDDAIEAAVQATAAAYPPIALGEFTIPTIQN